MDVLKNTDAEATGMDCFEIPQPDSTIQQRKQRMIQGIEQQQTHYINAREANERKALGQYFTDSSVAEYMASLIQPINRVECIRVLDAGAGSGILATYAALRCLEYGNKKVHAVLYEIDDRAIPLLKESMEMTTDHFTERGAKFTYEIKNEDFILARPDKTEAPFHISSINPPYFKYSVKESPYSGALSDLYKGDPNIYASFMAMVMACLDKDGQMVAIVPRSFSNGLYFKGFRKFLFSTSSLDVIHIFNARDKIFKDLEVLQENIICKFTKTHQKDSVEIRSSNCSLDINALDSNRYPSNLVLDLSNSEGIIRIPESKESAELMLKAETLGGTFQDTGYFISTGPVVEYRTRQFITEDNEGSGSVPLYRPHNIRLAGINWTGEQKKDAFFMLRECYEKHVSKNDVYVLMKRFSSKDEPKRLVAAVHDPSKIDTDFIGLGNKLNYIGLQNGPMSLEEANGISALFNASVCSAARAAVGRPPGLIRTQGGAAGGTVAAGGVRGALLRYWAGRCGGSLLEDAADTEEIERRPENSLV